MDQQPKKQKPNPLYLRPYTEGARVGSGVERISSARKFSPKTPSSPLNRPKITRAEEMDSADAAALLDRMDEAAQQFGPTGGKFKQGFNSRASSSRPQMKQQHTFMAPRIPVKSGSGGNSRNLEHVSFVQDGKYRPISVPFYLPQSENDASIPKQEAEKVPSKMFYDDDGNWVENQLLLLQAPTIVPDPVETRDEALSANIAGLHKIPDGKIGKLRIHKSGKVSMLIGGVVFDVSRGCDLQCHQEVCCVSPDQNICMFMGPSPTKAVMTPDIMAMHEEK